ncbi:MAG: Smr/MutS family protein [Candidatus Eisenbacteria bacterium]|nr:Smr/MutS family protein [Candidatus Eisenbacteria bacterium]
MNRHAARVVELPAVIRLLAQWVPSPLGAARLARLAPSHSRRVVRSRLARTKEAMTLLAAGESPPLEQMPDPAPALKRAAAGAILSGEELSGTGAFVTECVRVGDFLRRHRDTCPELHRLLCRIAPQAWDDLAEAETALRISIDAGGAVKDEASSKLRTIRATLRATDARVRDAAHGAVRELSGRDALQESVVHYRGGRPVLPVKADRKEKVPGVLRDVSASGSTLFVEPVEAARLGRLKERLLKDQDREERRIRRALTMQISELSAALRRLRAVIGHMEVSFAAAAFGLSRNGVCAELTTDGTLDLRTVYHPLLPPGGVPLTLRLDSLTRTLLITGPNTGGKTVALKSVGLSVLMTACGLPVLGREGTAVPVVRAVLADIGDEQSIEQSLSTFSGHMSNIVSVIEQVEEVGAGLCLVLLDELGAGTDPAEGEALGCAVLEWLHAKGGPHVRLLATSHFARLKELAASADGMTNARMEFNAATLRPTYDLSMGAAGASQAFPVAERLGLPGGILTRAQEFLGPERVEFQKLVASLDAERHDLGVARRNAEEQAARLEAELRRLRDEAVADRGRLATMRDEFRRQADEVLSWSRRELKNARMEEGLAAAQRRHVAIHERLTSAIPVETPAPTAARAAHVRPGDSVEVAGFGKGSLVEVDPKSQIAQVIVGAARVAVPVSQVRETGLGPRREPAFVAIPEEAVGPELLLLGLRADEARERVVRYVDDARAADMSVVRIVHGLGRGVLKEVVREALRSHPAVSKFRSGAMQEGGQGVTVAYLV